MGQVWQATDTQLNREVALKILPDAFADDPDRLARFTREAQILASLNHPNIAAIYGIEEAEGTRALVLELVEGPTLADRIAKGPLPIDEALPIAKQIAEALEAAHEAGVIHRDLKPANIKVREDGTVKVLDFGLAKAFAGDAPSTDLSQSPTVTAAGTREGVILGTAAYMSPEQARGQPLDKRTDIWSFGCVLYEMLTSRLAFGGDTLSDTMANILDRQPQWEALAAGTPPTVRKLLRRCLDKDPKERLRDVADVRWEIAESLSTRDADIIEAVAVPPPQAWQRPMPLVIAGLALFLVGGFAVWTSTPTVQPQPRHVTRFPAALPPDVLLGRLPSPRHRVAVSADGTRLVYAAADQLYLRDLAQPAFRPVRGTDRAIEPVFSPDGQWIAFWAAGQLQRVSVAGGAPVMLAEMSNAPSGGASWGADDTILINHIGIGISQVPGGGGTPKVVIPVESGEIGLPGPQLLPGGEWVLFRVYPGRQVAIQSLITGERQVLIENGAGTVRYVPTGHLVYAVEGTLLARPFDAQTQTLTPGPVSLVEGVHLNRNMFAQFDVASNGTLVYLPEQGVAVETLVWVDRDGQMTRLSQGNDMGVGLELTVQ